MKEGAISSQSQSFFGILAEGRRGVPECQAQSAPDGMAARQEPLWQGIRKATQPSAGEGGHTQAEPDEAQLHQDPPGKCQSHQVGRRQSLQGGQRQD